MPNYKVEKSVFTTADLSAILMGLSNLSTMIRGDELLNALAKVKSFIPTEQAKDIEIKANQIHVDLSPWMGNRNIERYLETIKKALLESKLLSFEYTDRHASKSDRVTEPYQLVLKSNHWYLHGYSLEKNDYRLFKLSRISNLQMQRETFTPRDYQKPQLDFADILETMQIRIIIRIHKSVTERVLEYCTQEDFIPDGKEHYKVCFPFIENDYYYNILMGFGDRCECLEPLPIRMQMKRRIQDMAALYEN